MTKVITDNKNKVSRRRFTGEVVGVAENKTIRVVVKIIKTMAKYRQNYTSAKKYPVHDETGRAKLGDKVVFEECRPISKTKRWTLVKVTKSANQPAEV